MDGLGGLMKTSVDPLPIEHPNHDQGAKDWVPQLFHVGQTELFGHPTVVCPKLVVCIQLQECIILPPELPLEWSTVLLPRKDGSMKTLLGDLRRRLSNGNKHQIHQTPTK